MATFLDDIRSSNQEEKSSPKRKVTWKTVVFSKALQGWFFIAVFVLVVPALTYYLVVNRGSYKSIDTFTCYVDKTFRVNCGQAEISENSCVNLGCCFDKPTNSCYHYLPSRYSYDLFDGIYTASRSKSPFGTTALKTLKVTINEISADKVSVCLHANETQFTNLKTEENKNYVINDVKEKLMVEIHRPDGELLLSTTKGPLIASDNYWEWTVYLNDGVIFGMDQILISLDENSTLTKVFYYNKHDQDLLPLFWAYKNGKFHSVRINHNGPLELTVLPSNVIVIKSLTGDFIELILSVGPTPQLLTQQEMQMNTTDLPYWLLGNHICKNQNTANSLSELIQHFKELDSEADSHCLDENLLIYLMLDDSKDTTGKEELKELLTKLNQEGKKFILSVPPQVLENSFLYNAAETLELLYTYNDTIYKGKYLDQIVAYPDFSHPNNQKYLQEIDNFLSFINVSIDGLILKDNWPVDESFSMDSNSFPYFTKQFQEAFSNTIQWNATVNKNLHIYKHNSYGPSQYEAFKKYYNTKKESKIIISATKLSSQTDSTIIQNVDVSWENLQRYLNKILFNSIAINQLVSLPVCGDTSSYNTETQEKLCIRWYIMAATMPLFRISTPEPWRNPDDLKSNFAQKEAKNLVEKRKQLLPYFYAILQQNQPVVRTMFYDNYEDTRTFHINNQYMIGDKILVAHPMTQDKNELQIYLPPKIKVWYELWAGDMYKTNETNPYINFDVISTDFIAFIAEGSILPLVRSDNIDLIVALNCTGNVSANGIIQINDVVINFLATGDEVIVQSNKPPNNTIRNIFLYCYNKTGNYVNIYKKNIPLSENTIISYVDPTTTSEPTTTTEATSSKETTITTTTVTTSSDETTSSKEITTTTKTTSSEGTTIETTPSEETTSTAKSTSSGGTTAKSTSSEGTSTVTTPSEETTFTTKSTSSEGTTTQTTPSEETPSSAKSTSSEETSTVTTSSEETTTQTTPSEETPSSAKSTLSEETSTVTTSSEETTTQTTPSEGTLSTSATSSTVKSTSSIGTSTTTTTISSKETTTSNTLPTTTIRVK